MINSKHGKAENTIKCIDFAIKAITLIGGIIVWMCMPGRVPTHFNSSFEPDSYGSKALLLIAFLMTVISFIPFSVDLPDKNIISDENMYDMLVRDEYKRAAIKRLVLASVMSMLFWGAMLLVLKNI